MKNAFKKSYIALIVTLAVFLVGAVAVQYGLAWTDPTSTSNSTQARKVHIDELRSATSNAL